MEWSYGTRATPFSPHAWSRETGERWRARGIVAALTWAIGWVLVLLLASGRSRHGLLEDAGTYYQAGQAFLQGRNYYASPDFRHWPLVAALWAPLALLPPAAALRLWLLGLLAAVGGGSALLLRRLREEGAAPGGRWATLTLAGAPMLLMLFLGQMSGLCFACFAAGLGWQRRRPWLAGCCFALMAAKPNLILLAAPALLGGPWAALVACALACLLWPLGSLLVGGPAMTRAFLLQLDNVKDSTNGLVASSLSSLLPLRGAPHQLVQGALLAALLAFLACLLVRRQRAGRPLTGEQVDLAAAVVLALLPYALVSDMLFLAPLLLRLGGRLDGRAKWLMAAWWLLPFVASALTVVGGGGIAALYAPALLLAARRRGPSPAPVVSPVARLSPSPAGGGGMARTVP